MSHSVNRAGGPPLMVVPTAILVAASVAVAVAAGPLYSLSQRAASDLLDRHAYIEKVETP